MDSGQSSTTPTIESISGYVKKNAAKVKKAGMMMHGDPVSVRQADYNGHHIVIRTTYHIEIDGTPVMGHLAVTNDGQVQYHPLPNMTFDSAVDLVKKVIDVFPDDFTKSGKEGKPNMPQRGMSGSMPSMAGMPKRSKPPSKAASPSKPRKSKSK